MGGEQSWCVPFPMKPRALPQENQAPTHQELDDQAAFLQGRFVDGHSLVPHAFQVPVLDHVTWHGKGGYETGVEEP